MTGDNSTGSDGNAEATTQAAVILDAGWLLAAAVEFYIDYAIIGIGVVGAVANAAVLYALIAHNARETKKRLVNWLIINQNLLDLCCCIIFLFYVYESQQYLPALCRRLYIVFHSCQWERSILHI